MKQKKGRAQREKGPSKPPRKVASHRRISSKKTSPIPYITRNIEQERRQSFRKRLVMLRNRLVKLEQLVGRGTPAPKLKREMIQIRQQVEQLTEKLQEGLPVRRERIETSFEFPSGYGDHKIFLMVRDPWWLYAYWEVNRLEEEKVHRTLRAKRLAPMKSILRVYDVTDILFDGTNAHRFFDIGLHSNANNWYLEVGRPNRTFLVEIGILATDGSFHPLCRSNAVTTPRFGMSEVIDEEWMTSEEEYWRMFGLSGGHGIGKSSMEVKEWFRKGLFEQVSSGGFSPGFKQTPWRPPSS